MGVVVPSVQLDTSVGGRGEGGNEWHLTKCVCSGNFNWTHYAHGWHETRINDERSYLVKDNIQFDLHNMSTNFKY